LINNAGMIKRNPILESKDADWDAVININLNAVYHMSMAAAKVFAKRGFILIGLLKEIKCCLIEIS